MNQMNTTVDRVKIHILLLMKIEINIKFERKQWLIRQEKKLSDAIEI